MTVSVITVLRLS